ncbi:MAG: hypothetical protein A2075_16370 [Geobacteraceae bacterium GWC2_58_44]|nr:MAG: hypothetical protein A2075_16370 [Geobacteraceae bacterium GWC2_58_44]
MAFFEWKESFNIGVEEIDRQHREFMEYLNEINELCAMAKDTPVSREVVDQLVRYIEKHFEYEENLFKETGYRESELQIKQHNFFVLRVLELQDEQLFGNVEKLNNVLGFLRDWFLNHILTVDSKYVPLVQAITTER